MKLLGFAFALVPVWALGADLPTHKLTPGDTVSVPLTRLCTKGYAGSVRNVTESTKHAVLQAYGIKQPKHGEYEIDHLISLELGGANTPKNLWPQSYLTKPWNAHLKDALENRLHALVCHGKLTLPQAQAMIRSDWVTAYRKYVIENPLHE